MDELMATFVANVRTTHDTHVTYKQNMAKPRFAPQKKTTANCQTEMGTTDMTQVLQNKNIDDTKNKRDRKQPKNHNLIRTKANEITRCSKDVVTKLVGRRKEKKIQVHPSGEDITSITNDNKRTVEFSKRRTLSSLRKCARELIPTSISSELGTMKSRDDAKKMARAGKKQQKDKQKEPRQTASHETDTNGEQDEDAHDLSIRSTLTSASYSAYQSITKRILGKISTHETSTNMQTKINTEITRSANINDKSIAKEVKDHNKGLPHLPPCESYDTTSGRHRLSTVTARPQVVNILDSMDDCILELSAGSQGGVVCKTLDMTFSRPSLKPKDFINELLSYFSDTEPKQTTYDKLFPTGSCIRLDQWATRCDVLDSTAAWNCVPAVNPVVNHDACNDGSLDEDSQALVVEHTGLDDNANAIADTNSRSYGEQIEREEQDQDDEDYDSEQDRTTGDEAEDRPHGYDITENRLERIGPADEDDDNDLVGGSSSESSFDADSDDDSSDFGSVDSEDEDAEQTRIWGPIRDITDDAVKRLASDILDRSAEDVSEVTIKSGLNNRVYILHYANEPSLCIRVPACGWQPKWTDNDRSQLRHTVQIMTFLSKNTSIPVPQVLHYDTELDNAINAPYIAMQFIAGVSPRSVWYPDHGTEGGIHWVCRFTYEPTDGPSAEAMDEDEHITNYVPTTMRLEQKRQTMLKSLASHLAQLQKFSFSAMGSPVFSSNSATIESIGDRAFRQFGVCARSDASQSPESSKPTDPSPPITDFKAYLLEQLEENKKTTLDHLRANLCSEDIEGRSPFTQIAITQGCFNFMELVISCLPGDLDESGGLSSLPFVLAPYDFGAQNMLCDPDTGAITGIIDWDLTETRPRYWGWALPPCWLLSDHWSAQYSHPLEGRTMLAKDYDRYRQDYAHYLREAAEVDEVGVDDWKYTAKGPSYEEIVASVLEMDPIRIRQTAKFIAREVYPRYDIDRMMEKVLTNDMRPGMKVVIEASIKEYLELTSESPRAVTDASH